MLGFKRLENIVKSPKFHSLDRRLDGAEAGHDDRDDVCFAFGDAIQEIQPAHTRHLQVAENQIETFYQVVYKRKFQSSSLLRELKELDDVINVNLFFDQDDSDPVL